jgi:shikimate dehydrogenase
MVLCAHAWKRVDVTDLYGIFGWPVAHSRSPAMHGAAFAALGLDAVYVPFAVPPDKLPAAVDAIRALGIAGLNITLPHKAAIIPLLDSVDAAALAIGAVNTVRHDGTKLVGTNTDAEGLARSLREANVVLAGANVIVLGAGGAARAAVVGLANAGAARIVVAARRIGESQALTALLSKACGPTELLAVEVGPSLTRAAADCTLLIQATSATLGTGPGVVAFAEALPLDSLPPQAVVCDLVYKPLRTAVLQRADTLGLRTVDGLGMLLHQGALAFELWTGQSAPIAVMRRALGF